MAAATAAGAGAKPEGLVVSAAFFLAVFITASLLLFRAWWGWMPIVPEEWHAVWVRDASHLVPAWPGFLLAWLRNLWSVLLLAAFELGSLAAGRAAYRLTLGKDPRGLWGALFSLGLGNGVLGTLALGAGLAGLLHPGLFAAALAAGAVAGGVHAAGAARSAGEPAGPPANPFSVVEKLLLGFCLFIAGVNFLAALIPEWFFDSLIYHMAIPNQFVIQRKVHCVPYAFVYTYPLLTEMQYLVFMVLGNDIAPRLLQWFNGVLCATASFGLAGLFLGRGPALLAPAVFLSQPVMRFLMTVTMQELTLTLFATLALAAFLEGVKGIRLAVGGSRSARPRAARGAWLMLGAWFLGLSHGVKYVGVITSAVLVGWLVLDARRCREKSGVWAGRLMLVLAWATAWTVPWLVKNWLFSGNPVSPFLGSFFPTLNWDSELYRGWVRDCTTIYGAGRFFDWLLLPFRVSVENPSFGGFTLNPFFILLIPALFLAGRSTASGSRQLEVARILGWFTAGYAALWAVTAQESRFLAPLAPAAAAAAAAGMAVLLREGWPVRFAAVAAAAWILAVSSNAALMNRLSNKDLVPYSMGRLSRTELLRHAVPYYAAMERAGTVMDSRARLLFVGENESHYAPRSCICSNFFDRYAPGELAKRSVDGPDLVRRLFRLRVTHLLVNESMGEQYAGSGAFEWGERGRKNFTQMWSAHVRPVYSSTGISLFELSASPGSAAARKTGAPSFFNDPGTIRRARELVAAAETAIPQGRLTDAFAAADELVRLMPKTAYAYYYRGYANEMLGRGKEAIADYFSAVRTGYPPAVVHFYLARLLDSEGRTAEALDRCLEAVRLEPGEQGARAFARDLALRLKRYGLALDLTEHMLAANPGDAGLKTEVERIGKLLRSGSGTR